MITTNTPIGRIILPKYNQRGNIRDLIFFSSNPDKILVGLDGSVHFEGRKLNSSEYVFDRFAFTAKLRGGCEINVYNNDVIRLSPSGIVCLVTVEKNKPHITWSEGESSFVVKIKYEQAYISNIVDILNIFGNITVNPSLKEQIYKNPHPKIITTF